MAPFDSALRSKPADPAIAAKLREFRLHKVMAMLEAEPKIRFALLTDNHSHKKYMIVSIAIRGLAAFEMAMPREKFDAWDMIQIINRHGGGVTETS